MEVLYARASYDQKERDAVNRVLDNPKKLVGGTETNRLEERVASLFDKNHGVMVNSGSSANYLAIESLDLPDGSEVITPATTFSTTVAPLVKNDLIPVFVDIDSATYQASPDQIQDAVSEETSAILLPSLVGNLPKFDEIARIAQKNDLYLIEDSADTIGAKFKGKSTGYYSDISTTSFYASHIITGFGGGGMLCVNDDSVRDKAMKLRGWGRGSAVNEVEDIETRLSSQLGDVQYDQKFIFDEVGYNFLGLEASAAFCNEQLDKLDNFARKRQSNFETYNEYFRSHSDLFVLPKEYEGVKTNWLAYPVQIRDVAPFNRVDLVTFLEEHNVQTRALWSGNIVNHPGFSDIDHRIASDGLPHANRVMKSAFVIGIHAELTRKKLEYVIDLFDSFITSHT